MLGVISGAPICRYQGFQQLGRSGRPRRFCQPTGHPLRILSRAGRRLHEHRDDLSVDHAGTEYGRTDCLILPNREIPRKIGQKLSGIRIIACHMFDHIGQLLEPTRPSPSSDYGVWQRFCPKWAIVFTISSHRLRGGVRLQHRDANSEVPSSG